MHSCSIIVGLSAYPFITDIIVATLNFCVQNCWVTDVLGSLKVYLYITAYLHYLRLPEDLCNYFAIIPLHENSTIAPLLSKVRTFTCRVPMSLYDLPHDSSTFL